MPIDKSLHNCVSLGQILTTVKERTVKNRSKLMASRVAGVAPAIPRVCLRPWRSVLVRFSDVAMSSVRQALNGSGIETSTTLARVHSSDVTGGPTSAAGRRRRAPQSRGPRSRTQKVSTAIKAKGRSSLGHQTQNLLFSVGRRIVFKGSQGSVSWHALMALSASVNRRFIGSFNLWNSLTTLISTSRHARCSSMR